MCNADLWQFVFPKIKQYTPIYIDITPASSFAEIDTIILSNIQHPAILVGFSLGGFSAMHFATNHPEKVKKLIVIAASSNQLNKNEITLRQSTLHFLQSHPYKGISNIRIKQFLHPINHADESLIAIVKKMDAELGKEVLMHQLRATSERIDLNEKLKTVPIPILLIGSNEDSIISSRDLIALKKILIRGNLVLLKNCGHMIPLEKPVETAEIINSYLNEF